ncbi:hypothetical protein MPC38_06790 [Prescottella equi]|uniref:hypothetical protein n=1 Tax=Rhodococcus hoagii TaxID=43767 RepID=UPI001F5B53EF|nr:hypothetical protein [Prescottella equi]UNQ40952.1 hypothetical protein MPC38_06790 [Prescottella equi]
MLEVPLSEQTIENATDVQTLDLNVYTDFIAQKRLWAHTWAYLPETDYNALRGFYDRQFTTFKYPRINIAHYGVTNVPVRMTLNTKEVVTHAGEVANVQVGFRETAPLPGVT